jgi:RimJ/RimL family protein N-acetyltransferase
LSRRAGSTITREGDPMYGRGVTGLDLPLSPDGVERRLADGGRVLLRPIRAEDADQLRDGFQRLSERSRFLRFFTPLAAMPDEWAARLTDIDHRTHRAWVAYDPDAPDVAPPGLGVGVARLIELDDDPVAAEAAIAITDDNQGRGIGRLMLDVVVGTAVAAGYEKLVTNVLRENSRMRELVRGIGEPVRTTGDGASVRIEVALDNASDEQVAQGALYDLLRLAARLNP